MQLFHHRVLADGAGLLFGFPDEYTPVSRWKNPDKQAIATPQGLEVVGGETGPNILVESESFGEAGTTSRAALPYTTGPNTRPTRCATNILRDCAIDPATPLPLHYFPSDDPTRVAESIAGATPRSFAPIR